MAKEKTGSIRTRKDGKMYAVVTYIDRFGKRRFKEKLVPNESAANRQIRKWLNKIDEQGIDSLVPKRKVFRELVEKYKENIAVAPTIRDGKTIRGLKSYKIVRYYADLWLDVFNNLRLDKITLSLIEEARNERLDELVEVEINVKIPNPNAGRKKWLIKKEKVTRPRKVASVNREMATLRAMFNYAVKDLKWLDKNPFDDTKKLIVIGDEVQRDRVLSRIEEIKMIQAIEASKSKFIKTIFYMALDCGLRKGEILKLEWKDVDLNEGCLTVTAENSKTEKRRTVFVSKRLLNELKKLAEMPSVSGKVVGVTDFKKSWQSAIDCAGVEDLRFHDLRHHHGTKAISVGVPLNEVRSQLGHADLRTTSRYLNRNSESAKNYAAMMDQRNEEISLEIERLNLVDEANSKKTQ